LRRAKQYRLSDEAVDGSEAETGGIPAGGHLQVDHPDIELLLLNI
jgi:hypothetical protein